MEIQQTSFKVKILIRYDTADLIQDDDTV
jgi:hypothetical protein